MSRTAMALVALFLCSFVVPTLSGAATSGRAEDGAEVTLTSILLPRASTGLNYIDNAILSSEVITFSVGARNIGNQTLKSLTVKAEVFQSNGKGEQVGTEPIFQTGERRVISSTDSSTWVEAGGRVANVDADLMILDDAGIPVEWLPSSTGLFIVRFTIDADEDNDRANNQKQVVIRVKDWIDIDIEMLWDSVGYELGQPADLLTSGGNGPHPFTAFFYVNTSKEWNLGQEYTGPRNITIDLSIEGDGVDSDWTYIDCTDPDVRCSDTYGFPKTVQVQLGMEMEVLTYHNTTSEGVIDGEPGDNATSNNTQNQTGDNETGGGENGNNSGGPPDPGNETGGENGTFPNGTGNETGNGTGNGTDNQTLPPDLQGKSYSNRTVVPVNATYMLRGEIFTDAMAYRNDVTLTARLSSWTEFEYVCDVYIAEIEGDVMNSTLREYNNGCEIKRMVDDNPVNDFIELEGTVINVHDASLDLVVFDDVREDGIVPAGDSSVTVMISHRGVDASKQVYNWTVDIDFRDADTGDPIRWMKTRVTERTQSSCEESYGLPYGSLGGINAMDYLKMICVNYYFLPGIYTIATTLRIDNVNDGNMNNNIKAESEFRVKNELPRGFLSELTTGPYVALTDHVAFAADAFPGQPFDDQPDDLLQFAWFTTALPREARESDEAQSAIVPIPSCQQEQICLIPSDQLNYDWVGAPQVIIRICDQFSMRNESFPDRIDGCSYLSRRIEVLNDQVDSVSVGNYSVSRHIVHSHPAVLPFTVVPTQAPITALISAYDEQTGVYSQGSFFESVFAFDFNLHEQPTMKYPDTDCDSESMTFTPFYCGIVASTYQVDIETYDFFFRMGDLFQQDEYLTIADCDPNIGDDSAITEEDVANSQFQENPNFTPELCIIPCDAVSCTSFVNAEIVESSLMKEGTCVSGHPNFAPELCNQICFEPPGGTTAKIFNCRLRYGETVFEESLTIEYPLTDEDSEYALYFFDTFSVNQRWELICSFDEEIGKSCINNANDTLHVFWDFDTGGFPSYNSRTLSSRQLSPGIYGVFKAAEVKAEKPIHGVEMCAVDLISESGAEVVYFLEGPMSFEDELRFHVSTSVEALGTDAATIVISDVFPQADSPGLHTMYSDHGVTQHARIWIANAFGSADSTCEFSWTPDGLPPDITVEDLVIIPSVDRPGFLNVTVDVSTAGDGWDELGAWLMCWQTSAFKVDEWDLLFKTDRKRNCLIVESMGKPEGGQFSFDMEATFGNDYYHFGIAPIDVLGNEGQSRSLAQVDLRDFSGTGGGTLALESSTDAESGLPSWTLPAIGVMFVLTAVGAVFILVRGGGGAAAGGDDDEDWDY